jgi:hypothetical protein
LKQELHIYRTHQPISALRFPQSFCFNLKTCTLIDLHTKIYVCFTGLLSKWTLHLY